MYLRIKWNIVEEIGPQHFEPFNLDEEDFRWSKKEPIDWDISKLTLEQTEKLHQLLASNSSVRGAQTLAGDVSKYLSVLRNAASSKETRPRTLQQFAAFLRMTFLSANCFRIYKRDSSNSFWLCYLTTGIQYHKPYESQGTYYPARVTLNAVYNYLGSQHEYTITFYEDDVRGNTTVESLNKSGYYMETAELREDYLVSKKRYSDTVDCIGTQFYCRGVINPYNVDGNNNKYQQPFVSGSETSPSKVVIDVFVEEGEEGQRSRAKKNSEASERTTLWFWDRAREGLPVDATSWKNSAEEEWTDLQKPEYEVPDHPFLIVFDLGKHLRGKVHISQLTAYRYTPNIEKKLILPGKLKNLISLLIEHKDAGFKDIIANKTGGAIVLLGGPPGVGKTLTAEVFAESESRALYSFQCSQLGLEPEEVEKRLLTIFSRAARWNAVLLLDEADVYVRQRAADLQQNAIVGVFLRTFEYVNCVMFLTTNRPKDIDDAIASRCVARIEYPMPTPAEQKRIWRVLCESSKVEITDEVISEIVEKLNLSGRDIKQHIKLAMMTHPGTPITFETIEFVHQFRPSVSQAENPA